MRRGRVVGLVMRVGGRNEAGGGGEWGCGNLALPYSREGGCGGGKQTSLL